MSNLGSVLNSALTSMAASQTAISVASNNIANAHNPNYTRQRLITTSAPSLDPTGIGSGISIVGLESARDQLVERRLLQEVSNKSGDEALHYALSDIETLFNDSESSGLLPLVSKFFNSFQTLSTDPVSVNFREQVRSSAQSLSDSLRTHRENLSSLQSMANQTISSQVDQVNTLGGQIAELTSRIVQFENTGSTADLRDQRSALVRQLSQIVDVRELDSDGTYQLSVAGNRLLVLGTTAQPLAKQMDQNGFIRIRSGGHDITGEIRGGQLKAQVQVRDAFVPSYLARLDQLAYEIVQQVNSRHTAGYDLNGNTGTDFFTELDGPEGAAARIGLSAAVQASASNIAASAQGAGQDNETAKSIGNLLFQPVFSGGSVTDQYGSLVFRIGTDAASAEMSYREHEALAHQLELRRQSISGVSIDEETIQIMQFQRAYEASARMIRVVDELTQIVLGIGL